MRYNHTPFAAPEQCQGKKKLTRKKHQFVHNELETERKKEKELRHTVRKTHARNSTKRSAPSMENFKRRKINATAAAPLILLPNRQKKTLKKKLKDKKGNH